MDISITLVSANRKMVACLGILLLASCTYRSTKDLKSCRTHFQGLTFSGMDAGQTHWNMDLAVVNPNKHPITLTKLHFTLMHEADTLLTGWNPSKMELAVGDSEIVRTNLDLPNAVWKRLPSSIWTQTDAQFLVTTDAYLDTWLGQIKVPNAVRETIHVNMPEQMAKYRDMLLQKMFSR